MEKTTYLKDWKPIGDLVMLTYSDYDVVYVKKEDFDRAFGCILSGEKEAIVRDFAVEV